MNEATLSKICAELESELIGQKFGKIFLLSRYRLAIDFSLPDSQYLFLSIEPSGPRIHLIKRRLRDLETPIKNPASFILFLRTRISNAILQNIERLPGERILRFTFLARNAVGQNETYFMVAQLTGRTANLFLLDERDFILDSIRRTSGPGQEIATRYLPPGRVSETRRQGDKETGRQGDREVFPQGDFLSLSEALDTFYTAKEIELRFQAKARSALQKIKREISKRKRLFKNLKQDLANHGQAENWKRFGDLLLANLANAERSGNTVFVTDFYDENTPTVEIEIDQNHSITEAAEKFFKLYTKARNAQTEISKRLKIVENELSELAINNEKLEKAIEEKDENIVSDFVEEKKSSSPTAKKPENFSGAKKFLSSDGFEILVGRRAKDNDHLTFRVAKSLDLWLHAADYPGSHVIVKNPNRQEIPPQTLLEAARIAAFYSQAKSQPKVAVHYTQKKFVNKPKGASPGLVSLASFKTILVVPKISNSEEQ